MEEKIVLSYPAEMEDDCLNWSYDQIGNIKADHWVARVITCLGVAGFIYNVKNVDYAQVFAVLIAIGCIRLLSLRLQKSAFLRSTEQPYENKKILCESGILSELGKRSWRGGTLDSQKEQTNLDQLGGNLFDCSQENARGRGYCQNSEMDSNSKWA